MKDHDRHSNLAEGPEYSGHATLARPPWVAGARGVRSSHFAALLVRALVSPSVRLDTVLYSPCDLCLCAGHHAHYSVFRLVPCQIRSKRIPTVRPPRSSQSVTLSSLLFHSSSPSYILPSRQLSPSSAAASLVLARTSVPVLRNLRGSLAVPWVLGASSHCFASHHAHPDEQPTAPPQPPHQPLVIRPPPTGRNPLHLLLHRHHAFALRHE